LTLRSSERLTTIHLDAGSDQTPQGEIRRIGKSANHAEPDLGSESDKQNQIRLQSARAPNSARWDW
jgi:hypothetical protein